MEATITYRGRVINQSDIALVRRIISANPCRSRRFLETFVDPQRFRGVCYKADNWRCVGETTGRGKLSESPKALLPKKAVYVYPLSKDFRRKLCQEPSPC